MKLLADNAPSGMKEQKFESYFGRKIAIDASMSIYQFLVCTFTLYVFMVRMCYVLMHVELLG